MIRLERRKAPSRQMLWLTPVLAVVLTMIFGGLLFAVLKEDVSAGLRAIHMIFIEPFTDSYSQRQLLIKGGPLILIAVGLSLGFRAGVWNIGAEGQFIMGAIGGGAVGLALYGTPGIWVLPLMATVGALAGFAWAMIPAFLKIRFNANEILVSLMLVYVAENFLRAMVTGALKNPDGRGFPESRSLADYASAEMPMLIKSAGLTAGGLVALGAVVAAYALFARHRLGYQIKLTGQAPRAARFSGVKPGFIVAACLGISGALAGMAGLFELVGPAGKLTTNFPLGYGFTAIIVAFLGRLHPVGILLAGILMAATYVGGETVQFQLQVPAAAIRVFQGMLLFFLLAVDVLVAYRIVRKKEAR